ncbi:MAG: hypothetical protein RLZZ450_7191 [Pseudomonadota bacterium]|jgi:hypothetical protein
MTRDLWLILGLISTLACGASDDGASSDVPEDTDSGSQVPGKSKDAGRTDAGSGQPAKRDSGTSTSSGNSNACEKLDLTAMATPPDILIVLDRSTSMLMGR